MVPCLRDYVAMSLRGKEPTEAISCLPDKKEIAALPAGARNDKEVIAIQSGKRGTSSIIPGFRIALRLSGMTKIGIAIQSANLE